MKIRKAVVKLYIKYLFENLADGATVDEVSDTYIEFYDNGVLTNVSKSAYTMTEADVMMVQSQIEQMENSQAMMQHSAQSTQSEYLIQCVDGVRRLVERHSATIGSCGCCVEYAYYDALTGEVISQ